MKKNKLNTYLILGIITILFNILYFVIPFDKENIATFWVNYGCFMLMLLVQFMIFGCKNKSLKSAQSKLLKLPVLLVDLGYIAVQIVSLLVLTIINAFVSINVLIPMLVNVVVLALFLVMFISTNATVDIIIDNNKKLEENKIFINELKVDISTFYNKVNEKELKDKIYELKEIIDYSDPVSSEDLLEIEDRIDMKYSSLKNNYSDKDYKAVLKNIDELVIMMQERNKLCKLYKKK